MRKNEYPHKKENNKFNVDNDSCITINREKEPKFIEYVKDRIEKEGVVKLKDLINSGARKVGISPVTAKRYLDKHASEGGELMTMDFRGEVEIFFSQYHDFSKDPRIIERDSLKEL